MKLVESRGIDLGQDFLQIIAGSFESNFGESGEDRACQRMGTSALKFQGRATSWVSKMKAKVLEAGQRREAGDHRLGWNVPRKGNTIKVKFDEMNGRH